MLAANVERICACAVFGPFSPNKCMVKDTAAEDNLHSLIVKIQPEQQPNNELT
jgi:hypothetical protein